MFFLCSKEVLPVFNHAQLMTLFNRDPFGAIVGGLVGVSTGLMLSGKFVPCVGVSGVAVGLSGRGSGFGGKVVAQVRRASLFYLHHPENLN